jgi:hypothetical protein
MAARFSLRLLPEKVAERFAAVLPETGAAQEDPPPTAQLPETPEPSPPMAPESPPPAPIQEPTAQVIDLNKAKQTGIDEHKAYVSQVTDLCTLARAADRVGAYVRAGTPVDQVRKELLELRASADVLPHHPLEAHARSQSCGEGRVGQDYRSIECAREENLEKESDLCPQFPYRRKQRIRLNLFVGKLTGSVRATTATWRSRRCVGAATTKGGANDRSA